MYLTQNYSECILGKVEHLASRVHLLKNCVKLEHYWELAQVRRTFAEFKWRVEQFENDDDLHFNRDYQRIEVTWNELMPAVDALLTALP